MEDILLYVLGFCVLWLMLCALMQIRNNIVYVTRMFAFNEKGIEFYYSLVSYRRMLFDFSCWTREGFIEKATMKCKGKNCKSTNSKNHSKECVAAYDKTITRKSNENSNELQKPKEMRGL